MGYFPGSTSSSSFLFCSTAKFKRCFYLIFAHIHSHSELFLHSLVETLIYFSLTCLRCISFLVTDTSFGQAQLASVINGILQCWFRILGSRSVFKNGFLFLYLRNSGRRRRYSEIPLDTSFAHMGQLPTTERAPILLLQLRINNRRAYEDFPPHKPEQALIFRAIFP